MSGKIKWQVTGKKVRGYQHLKTGKPCQDAIKWVNLGEEGVICAVADGHGSLSCPYSDEGAELAVSTALSLLESFIFENEARDFYSLLNQAAPVQLPQTLERQWKEAVSYRHQQKSRSYPEKQEELWKLYGTTLIVLWVSQNFTFAFQIGDGDLLMVKENGEIDWLIAPEEEYGTETYSLCQKESWKYVKTKLCAFSERKENPVLWLLSTDGYKNSFVRDKDFLKAGQDYMTLLKSHDMEEIEGALTDWLLDTSKEGSGDDITLGLVMRKEELF